MQSNLSGFSRRSTTLSSKTCASRRAGFTCFSARTAIPFEDCLRENDVIRSREQRALVRQQLAETKHAKLLLKTDQPVCYTVLSDVKQGRSN